MAPKKKSPTTTAAGLQTLRIGSRVRCTDDGVEGRIVWANGVSVKIKWDDGEPIAWRRDSLAGRLIEILASDGDRPATPPVPAAPAPDAHLPHRLTTRHGFAPEGKRNLRRRQQRHPRAATPRGRCRFAPCFRPLRPQAVHKNRAMRVDRPIHPGNMVIRNTRIERGLRRISRIASDRHSSCSPPPCEITPERAASPPFTQPMRERPAALSRPPSPFLSMRSRRCGVSPDAARSSCAP